MSGQRAQPAVPADHRSAHPKFPGVPWWGAALLAITATAIGFAFDAGSGSRELSSVFAVCYVLGSVLAVLAVRQAGVFTAVIQPPLILFVAVPGSYFLFHGGQLGGLKDIAINCGYPLIERFPLMLFTSAAVLLIGLGRWYFSLATRNTEKSPQEPTRGRGDTQERARTPIVAALTEKISGLLFGKPATRRSTEQDPTAEPAPRRRPSDRPTRRRPASAQGSDRAERKPTKRTAAARKRPTRPPETDLGTEVRSSRGRADARSNLEGSERPRRPRAPRPSEPPLVPPAEPRRRVRTQPREPRKPPPADRRGDVAQDRPQRRRRFDDYQPFEEPFEARPTNGHTPGRSTHHPVSRVRYRGAEDEDNRAEYRSRRSAPRDRRGDAWEFDA